MSMDPNAFLMGSSVKSAFTKDDPVGTSVTGYIKSFDLQQQRDINSGEAKFWKDGRPMQQLRVILELEPSAHQAAYADDEDTKERAIYLKGKSQQAVSQAIRNAGAKQIEVGGKLRLKFTGLGEAPGRGMNPPKLYEAQYRPPQHPVNPEADDLNAMAGQTAPSQPAQTAPEQSSALPF